MKDGKFKLLIYIFLLFSPIVIFAQPKCYFKHYASVDGLPQNSIMDIHQDKNGFMWFATWDGLCRFDGYNFKTYRIHNESNDYKGGNRMEKITADSNGYLWITLPYEKKPLRFDPKTEKFSGFGLLEKYTDLPFTYKKIIATKSGKVWFVSDASGCICVLDPEFNIEIYNKSNTRLATDKVYDVHEDGNGNSWLLTDKGLYLVSGDGSVSAITETSDVKNRNYYTISFYSVLELSSEIWFGSDKGSVWIYDKQSRAFKLKETGSSSDIQHIQKIDEENILVVTSTDGFFVFHEPSDGFTHYSKQNLPEMGTNIIHSCYLDKDRNVWLELDRQGVARFNIDDKILKHYHTKVETSVSNVFPSNFFILEDKNKRTWVHPRGGGFSLFDKEKDRLIPFYNEPLSPNWRFSNMLYCAYSDIQGNLWLGARSQGLEKIMFKDDIFNTQVIDKNVHTTVNNDVRCIYFDSGNRMWISTKLGKILVYDENKTALGFLCRDGSIGYSEPLRSTCYSILEDNSKNIWIGTKGDGLYRLQPESGNDKYKVAQYKSSEDDLYSLTGNSIYSIFQDNKNRVWIGSYGTGGLNLFDEDKDRFINIKNQLKGYPPEGAQIRIISSDKYGNICVGTTLGLIIFSSDFKQTESIQYKLYTTHEGEDALYANDIYDICTTRMGETYLATFGGGLSRIKEVDGNGFPINFETYSTQNGLPSNIILNIIEDLNSNLWITTEGSISKLNTQTKEFETYSEARRTLSGTTISEGSRAVAGSGTIYFGYSKGLIFLDPDEVNNNTYKPYVAVTKLQISNKDIPIEDISLMTENIDDLKYIKLNHKQNIISLEFVALDFVDPSNIVYAYMLDGFDNDWIVTQNQRFVNYTNLIPGEYRFKVRSTNSDGVWMDNEHVLDIEITPSFWRTKWAYLLYLAVIIMIIYLIMRILFVFYRLKDKIKLEHEESEMKIRFFTDISHEIRTPLTMIVSPVENILHNSLLADDVKNQLQLVLKNTHRMIRMVNQILDFRKVQKQKLIVQKTVIGDYVEEICNSFIKISHNKDIEFLIVNTVEDKFLWVDRDSFEKLLINLLFNAYKYTPEGKKIEINVRHIKKDETIEVEVSDQGVGMTRDIQSKLFVRFASFNKDKSKPSTGIGLSIVKEIVDKHHAKLAVSSEENKGTSFSVFFKEGLEHFKNDSNVIISNTNATVESQSFEIPDANIYVPSKLPASDSNVCILLVEDDAELRDFIKAMLAPHYKVLEAANGKIGFELASEHLPDFIISDIMMPEMDGLEFLQKIRITTRTSHIPFILLSAKSDIESKLSGLEFGADDYITKPFNVNYLKARIQNIINLRKGLMDSLAENWSKEPIAKKSTPNEQALSITPQDESFILKVKDNILDNMSDNLFLIDDLASAMAMSRTVFFKKFKSLTGQAPIDFIHDLKMNHAAKLLVKTDYLIKEISNMVGISDTKYFTQCFKKKFKLPPTVFRTKYKEESELP